MENETPIFISYRRNPSVEFARTIHYALSKFHINSFFDYTSIRDGHFNDNIYKAIDACRYLFLIVMDGALERMAETEDDWVRKELEYAVEKGKTIVPLVQEGHRRTWPEKLPEKLECLRSLQISKIDNEEHFEITLRQVLLDRTNLLDSVAVGNPIIPRRRIRLSKALAIGYNLTHFSVRYLRKQTSGDDIQSIRNAQPGITIPFPPVVELKVETMIEYLEKCAEIMAEVSGYKAGQATRFGIYYHLSDIAKRSNISDEFAHSYDNPLIDAAKNLGLPDEYIKLVVESSGLDMMDYYDVAKDLLDCEER